MFCRRIFLFFLLLTGLLPLAQAQVETPHIPASERAVLMALYASTNGAGWRIKSNWGGAVGTECNWYGVHCINSGGTILNVDEINLSHNKLVGVLPNLSGLRKLIKFNVYDNNLTGSFDSLSSLTSLTYFNVSSNQLTGPIPSLSGMTKLEQLDVSGNNTLTGPIPNLSGLTSLTAFIADYCQLTGTIPPSLSGLTKLNSFSVEHNQLTGPIPTLTGLTSLESFDASNNQLTGPIPSLSGLTKLYYFTVVMNQLTSITSFSGLRSLTFFDAHNNQLTGPIPSLSDLTELTHFDISENRLTGSISSLSGSSKLTNFRAFNNRLTGPITFLSGLKALEKFGASGNLFTGIIPSLTHLTSLTSFEVGNNLLTGPLPSPIGPSELAVFRADNNRLTGSILSLSGPTALYWFSARGNQLTGPMPVSLLSNQTELGVFDVSGNRLTGSIPSLSNLTELSSLDVSGNRLTNSIPSLSGLNSLSTFNAHNNQLTGPIPSLSGLRKLEIFSVGNNQLTGPITNLSTLTTLRYFYGSNNRLTGLIPPLSGLTALQVFYAENNQLTGTVPPVPVSLTQGSLCGNSLISSGDAFIDAAWDKVTRTNWLACQVRAVSLVDPVPSLLATLFTASQGTIDTSALTSKGRIVKGVSADGVTKIVLRIGASQVGEQISFTVNDPNSENGTLGTLSGNFSNNTVSVTAVSTPLGPMAFALYKAPKDFARWGGIDDNLGIRTVNIVANYGGGVLNIPVEIFRPPVVLVHGIWSDPSTWNFFNVSSTAGFANNQDLRFYICRADYQNTNGEGFSDNSATVFSNIKNCLLQFTQENNVAAIQVDIVAHSMGGNIARTMATNPYFRSERNYGLGNIHKLITINTPHLGSRFANNMLASNSFCKSVFEKGGKKVGGGVTDLSVGSEALKRINKVSTASIFAHAIAGVAREVQTSIVEHNADDPFIVNLFNVCPSLLPDHTFAGTLGYESDLIVSKDSQLAIGLGYNGISVPNDTVYGIIHSVDNEIFTAGPDALSRGIDTSTKATIFSPISNPIHVIDLLNASVLGSSFGLIKP